MSDPEENEELPRGIRNKNPGNIRGSRNFIWRGQAGCDPDGYARFIEPEWGIRAIAILWRNYETYHGCRCLWDYIERWAPSPVNDVGSYVSFMSEYLDVDPGDPLDIHALAECIIAGVIQFENGIQPYSLGLIRRGLTFSHSL